MPPSKPAYDVDWVWSNNSNVHVANHRDWFTTYTPFSTTFGQLISGADTPVLGVGDVELPTKTHPTRAGAAYHGTIVLRNVLYAPNALCNIIGNPILRDNSCQISMGAGTSKITRDTGACIGLLDLKVLYRLRLRGQSAKQTSLEPGGLYVIHAIWPSSERASWEAFRANRHQAERAGSNVADRVVPQLTGAEKEWLKEHYGGEFKFLRVYGLSIYKDEDREEGRRILRAMMVNESEDGESDGDRSESDEDSLDSFQRDLEDDPSSHAADYHFSAPELNWIKANYRHSGNFLLSYGLKFYNDEDCEEGKSIVQAMMEDSS